MPNPTLDEADATDLATWEATFTPTLNGIDCNSCGEELYDTYPGLTCKLQPPQTDVHCGGCGFKGHRIKI